MGQLRDHHKIMEAYRITCDQCGITYGIGDSPWCRDRHESVLKSEFGGGFEPYVDADILPPKDPRVALSGYRNANGRRGVLIDSRSTRAKLMKELGLQFGGNHPGGREV